VFLRLALIFANRAHKQSPLPLGSKFCFLGEAGTVWSAGRLERRVISPDPRGWWLRCGSAPRARRTAFLSGHAHLIRSRTINWQFWHLIDCTRAVFHSVSLRLA